MTVLYLVRHAHSSWQPSEDRPLSTDGLAQAERVAEVLANCGAKAIYSSPFRRAVQTVEPLATRIGVRVQLAPDLRERKLSSEAIPNFEAVVRSTWADFGFSLPGGESNNAAQVRVLALLRRISATCGDGVCVVSTHGNLLALALAAIDSSIGFDFWRRLTFPDIIQLTLVEPLGRSTFQRVWTEAG